MYKKGGGVNYFVKKKKGGPIEPRPRFEDFTGTIGVENVAFGNRPAVSLNLK